MRSTIGCDGMVADYLKHDPLFNVEKTISFPFFTP